MAGWVGLLGLILLCQGVGAAGALFTADSIGTWYAGLVKPAFNPPSWVFGPVWTLLYLMMAVACWLVIRAPAEKAGKARALWFFAGQLAANGIWSPLFFGLKNPGLAFADILVLWVLIGVTVAAFLRISKPAALLLIPYWGWVSFAAVLNFSFWQLN